MYGKRERFDT
uniref:Uncharacterized protein n=1 Tax=Rhizophora mucronata TaxID=61149 RepID=A0A2P2JGA8_RHIMU